MGDFEECEIENFSCWNAEIHGNCIEHLFIRLYPRGVEGKGENLVVSVQKLSDFGEIKALSFIGSDGYVICTRQPDAESGDVIIFTGPKFVDVVARIRGNEPGHKDRLILRWRKRELWAPLRLQTAIDAYSGFFEITPELFDFEEHVDNPKEPKWNDWKQISSIYCNFEKELRPLIILSACLTSSTLEDAKVKFKFESRVNGKIKARTSIWMIKDACVIKTYEDNSFLVKDDDLVLSYEVPLKELHGLQNIMRVKITTGESCENFVYSASLPLSPNICFEGFTSFFIGIPSGNADNALANDLKGLYKALDFSDFEMRCRGVSFPTHRIVLSARSPVLKAMLSAGMSEATSGHMDVEDLDPQTLDRFLSFLYSGHREDHLEWEGALWLYYAADKYQVPALKEECTVVLEGSVMHENVCDILSLADRHQDEVLRTAAHTFILENSEKLMLSDPLLVAKTLTHFTKTKYVQKRSRGKSPNCESLSKRTNIPNL